MAEYIRPRGTLDIYEQDSAIYDFIEKVGNEVARLHHFKKITTPTFEHTNLFVRSTGESSDIVKKEMYDFQDKGGRNITLRPEGTAGVIRSVIENKLYAQELPLRYYYMGSFFRYERPGLGRYREFHQYGVEMIGANSYLDDVDNLFYVVDMLKRFGLDDYLIKINSFGNETCRNRYRDIIQQYFTSCIDDLCEDCKARLKSNPLRILDCKIDKDYFASKEIPTAIATLDEENREEFNKIIQILEENDVHYMIDHHLVRGLDYYTGLIFEVEFKDKDGRVYILGGGGRYNNLVKELGGPELPCVGFAWGVERLSIILKEKYGAEKFAKSCSAYLMPLGENALPCALKLLNQLRKNDISTMIESRKKGIGAMFKYASKQKIKFALIIGDEELNNQTVQIKNLQTQVQQTLPFAEVVDYLKGEIL